jgi:uncharacterized membrane protein YhaH (DUF805 family)
VTFTESIRAFFSRYTDFRGRTPRSGYWWVALFLVAVSIVMWGVDMALFQGVYPQELLDQGLGPVSLLLIAATAIPNLALGFRRLHDTGRSAWWILIFLGPLLVSSGVTGTLENPMEPTPLAIGLGVLTLIGGITLLVFYLLPSTPGSNQYGPNPLVPDLEPDASI